MKSEPEITAVTVIEGKDKIAYSTENWDIKEDLNNIFNVWHSSYTQYITIYGIKYSVLQATPERLIATSVKGVGHIVGAQQQEEERRIVSFVEPHGNMVSSYVATARALGEMSVKHPYLEKDTELGITEEEAIKKELIARWDKPKLRSELLKGLIEFFDKGTKLEKPDPEDIKRIERERQRRMNEVNKLLKTLEITREYNSVNISIKAEFDTDYIYDDFTFLNIKRKIENLLKENFQIEGLINIEITKKF